MIAYALLLAMQAAQPATPPVDPRPAPWPEPERDLRNAGAFQNPNSPEARLMVAKLANCVLERSEDKVVRLLTSDFRTTAYNNGLRNVMNANYGCARKAGLVGRLRMDNLPFAAALAETMLLRDPTPLNVRLAKAAQGPQTPTFSRSDEVATCVARSAPDDVAALLTSEPGFPSETQALAKVEPVARLCSGGQKLELSPSGLRAIIATASYRLLAKRAV